MMAAVRTLPAERAAPERPGLAEQMRAVGAVMGVVAVLAGIRFAIYAACALIVDPRDFSWAGFVWINIKDFASPGQPRAADVPRDRARSALSGRRWHAPLGRTGGCAAARLADCGNRAAALHVLERREAELVCAYLDLQKVRMGRRLDYRVHIPSDLGALRIPPMMLLTLVENAIKHGLAPQCDGGRVDVGASLEESRLRLEVTDTGGGFGGQVSGGGTGLANIRTRLVAMFGAAAELTLSSRRPHGLVATIRMPLETA